MGCLRALLPCSKHMGNPKMYGLLGSMSYTSKGTCQDAEQSPNLMTNRLPDEVLLEVFDSYRQSFDDQNDDQWRKKYAWFNLAHVCRRWRAVVFASYSRLDSNIVVGAEKPGQLKAILSGHLPILIDYSCSGTPREITYSAVRRMRAALRHRDRVREISFGGWLVDFMGTFFSETNYHFPALESLVLCFLVNQEEVIPATFLRGPDQSDLPLRRLKLYGGSLASVSGLLLSATALTDLTLNIPSNFGVINASPSPESVLLACFQGMQCLRSLDLTTPCYLHGSESQLDSTLEDIVLLLKLTRFHYSGPTMFLNNFIPRLSAPSLQDARFQVVLCNNCPFWYLSRVIDEVREAFRSISVTFKMGFLRLVSSTQSGKLDHSEPSFSLYVNDFPNSTNVVNSRPSTKLAMVEELSLYFPTRSGHDFSLPEFLRPFRSVRVLRVNPFYFVRELGLCLQQDVGEAIFPLLEEIELSDDSDEEYQCRAAEAVAALEPFASARGRAGHLVKVYHGERR